MTFLTWGHKSIFFWVETGKVIFFSIKGMLATSKKVVFFSIGDINHFPFTTIAALYFIFYFYFF